MNHVAEMYENSAMANLTLDLTAEIASVRRVISMGGTHENKISGLMQVIDLFKMLNIVQNDPSVTLGFKNEIVDLKNKIAGEASDLSLDIFGPDERVTLLRNLKFRYFI